MDEKVTILEVLASNTSMKELLVGTLSVTPSPSPRQSSCFIRRSRPTSNHPYLNDKIYCANTYRYIHVRQHNKKTYKLIRILDCIDQFPLFFGIFHFKIYIPHPKGPTDRWTQSNYASRTPKFQGWHHPFSSTLKIDKTVKNLRKQNGKRMDKGSM